MTIQACMGGWCRMRERCQHYHAENRNVPRERLCEPGQDNPSEQARVAFYRDQLAIDAARRAHREAA